MIRSREEGLAEFLRESWSCDTALCRSGHRRYKMVGMDLLTTGHVYFPDVGVCTFLSIVCVCVCGGGRACMIRVSVCACLPCSVGVCVGGLRGERLMFMSPNVRQ